MFNDVLSIVLHTFDDMMISWWNRIQKLVQRHCAYTFVHTMTTLPWKRYQPLLNRLLVVSEYRTMKSVRLVKYVSKKFSPSGPLVHVPLFSWRNHLKKVISINHWNVIKIVRAVFEKIVKFIFRDFVRRAPIFGARILMLTAHLLKAVTAEWKVLNRSGNSEAHVYRDWLTELPKQLFHIWEGGSKTRKSVKN